MSTIAVFQTPEQKIRTRILKNLLASDGKERTYFDVMRGVDMTSDLADPVFTAMQRDGLITTRLSTVFPTGNRAPTQLVWYRGSMRRVRELLDE